MTISISNKTKKETKKTLKPYVTLLSEIGILNHLRSAIYDVDDNMSFTEKYCGNFINYDMLVNSEYNRKELDKIDKKIERKINRLSVKLNDLDTKNPLERNEDMGDALAELIEELHPDFFSSDSFFYGVMEEDSFCKLSEF